MRLVCWACVALFLCLLTACSDDSSSSVAPPTGSTPPSVTSSPPDPSPSPERQTPEEFVRAWVAEYNAMQNTGDTETFRKMSRRCETCKSAADRIDKIYEDGGFVETEGWTVNSMKVSQPNGKGQRALTLDVDSAPTRFSDAKGGPIQTFDGGPVTVRLSVEPNGDEWNVFDIEQVAR